MRYFIAAVFAVHGFAHSFGLGDTVDHGGI
jgi:hypothetical protein